MTRFTKFAAVAILAMAPATAAFASPITGAVSISGSDTFDASKITFNPSTGVVLASTGTMSAFTFPNLATLTSFTFAAPNVTVFSVTNALNQVLTFTITNLISHIYTPANGAGTSPTLSLSGTGTFTQSGFDATSGSFSLTSSTTGITSFQIVSSAAAAVTPEPSSLLLLGTGLIGAATTMVRRRRMTA